MSANKSPSRKTLLNIVFACFCIAIFLFLWNAPPETTAKMPWDDDHKKYYPMDRKEAEKECENCHKPEGVYPLPVDHPPKYRCLFCHKKQERTGP